MDKFLIFLESQFVMNNKRFLLANLKHFGRVRSMAITPDGKQVITVASDDFVRIWNLATNECTTVLTEKGKQPENIELPPCQDWANRVAITPDCNYTIILTTHGKLMVWDLKNEKFLKSPVYAGGFECIAITPNSEYILGGEHNYNAVHPKIKVFKLDGQASPTKSCLELVTEWDAHSGSITALAVLPESLHFLSASSEGYIREWTIESNLVRQINSCNYEKFCINSVAVTHDGKTIISGDSTAVCVYGRNGDYRAISNKTGCINSVAVTPDGKYAIAGDCDKIIRIWALDTMQLMAQFTGHANIIRCIAVTPDGRRILTGGNDHIVRIWDLEKFLIPATLYQ